MNDVQGRKEKWHNCVWRVRCGVSCGCMISCAWLQGPRCIFEVNRVAAKWHDVGAHGLFTNGQLPSSESVRQYCVC
jgi:hypothetical protein